MIFVSAEVASRGDTVSSSSEITRTRPNEFSASTSQRNLLLRQSDALAIHRIERQRVFRGLNRQRLFGPGRMLGEKWQKHVAVLLVRLAVCLEIGNLFPGKADVFHPFLRHAGGLAAA